MSGSCLGHQSTGGLLSSNIAWRSVCFTASEAPPIHEMIRAIKTFFLGLPYAFVFMIAMACLNAGLDWIFTRASDPMFFFVIVFRVQILLVFGMIVAGIAGCARANNILAAGRWGVIGGSLFLILFVRLSLVGSGSESTATGKEVMDSVSLFGEYAVAALALVVVGIQFIRVERRQPNSTVLSVEDESAGPPPSRNDDVD